MAPLSGPRQIPRVVKVVPPKDGPPTTSKPRLPAFLRFPVLVLWSLTLSALGHVLVSRSAKGDLTGALRGLGSGWEMGALVGWRTFELGLAWFGGYDWEDVMALSVLSHGPTLYLLKTFYGVKALPVTVAFFLDTVPKYTPFGAIRPMSPAHKATWSRSQEATVPNYDILTDVSVQIYITLLGASIYSLTLYGAYSSYLPTYLVQYFNDIPSVAAVYTSTLITLVPWTLVVGIAAKSFIFTPSMVESRELETPLFNPVTATLGETFWYNVWGYTPRTKVVIKRTVAAMLVSGVNTYAQTLLAVEGVERLGAMGFSGIWVVAAVVTGGALGVAGSV